MAHKTKAEKIAAALRSKKRNIGPVTAPQQTDGASVSEVSGYYASDLLHTFAITAFIVSLLVATYVLRIKGYIQ